MDAAVSDCNTRRAQGCSADGLQEKTGELGNQCRNLALLPDSVLRRAVAASRTTVEVNGQDQEVPLTPIDAAQVGLTWRIARRLMTSGSLGWDS